MAMEHYFDHAATAPMRQVAVEAWQSGAALLNPAAQYAAGRRARAALETAREQIAQLLDCEPIEVVFTASGTEADATAITGFWAARHRTNQAERVVASPIEHPAVRENVAPLPVEYLGVNAQGVVDDFTALEEPAAVVTCMLANNETGAIQPIAEIVRRAQATNSPVHVDAVQAVGHIPVSYRELGVTTLAASAHKFGGPRGMGLLVAPRSPIPDALVRGGGQERGLRSGTVDVAGAMATAAALAEAVAELESEQQRLRALTTQLREGIVATVPDVVVHTPQHSLPGHLHLSFPGAEGDSLIMLLDHAGIAASTGSACSQGVNRASEVLLAMGVSEQVARGAIRFTLGSASTSESVAYLLKTLPNLVTLARRAGMA